MACETIRTFLRIFLRFFQNLKNMTFYVVFELLRAFSRTLPEALYMARRY